MAVPGAVALARLVAAVSGDRVLVAGMAAGLVVGGAAGVLATNPGNAGATRVGAGILGCPNDQVALLRVASGQRMLVTGRTADGTWYRVYLGSPGRTAGWVKSDEVTLEAAGDTLPVVDCDGRAASATEGPESTLTAIVAVTNPSEGSPSPSTETPSASAEPSAATATIAPTVGPTARPTRTPRVTPTATPRVRATHTPTPKPTKTPKPPPPPTAPPPPPDTTRPTISDMFQDASVMHFCNQGLSANAPHSIRFTASGVKDEAGGSGIDFVQLWVERAGEDFPRGPFWMVKLAFPNRWGLTVQADSLPEGDYQWYVLAHDKAGNERVHFDSTEGPAEFSNTSSCIPN